MAHTLEEFGLTIRHSDAPDRSLVDFSIEDGEDNVAWAWGNDYDDLDWECNHPEECREFGDDDEYGECLLCGSHCNWGWVEDVVDEGHDEDGNYTCQTGKVRQIGEWFGRKSLGGVMGDIVAEMKKNKERS